MIQGVNSYTNLNRVSSQKVNNNFQEEMLKADKKARGGREKPNPIDTARPEPARTGFVEYIDILC